MVETRGGRRFAVLFLAAAFALLVLGRWLAPVNHAALSVAAPFLAVINGVSTGIGDGIAGVVEGPRLRGQNEQLKAKLAMLLRENVVLQQDRYENTLLRHMLKFDDANPHISFLPARVISNDPNSLAPYIIINRGTRDGIRAGMTVVEDRGYFVGSISDATVNAAKVLLMTSPSSSVGAMDLQTHAGGLVEGQYAARPQFRWSVASSIMHVGDFVVTSGQLNLYPRNLLLGQIVRIRHSNVSLFQTADLQPLADFQHLDLVQVVRNFVPSEPVKLVSH